MSSDLQAVARDVWARALMGDRPTGPEIQDRYNLDKSQFDATKRYVRGHATGAGIMWAYYPKTGRYMVAPNDSAHAREMLDYQLRHWQAEGASANDTFTAAQRQGLVSEFFAGRVDSLATEFDARIDSLAREFEGDDAGLVSTSNEAS